MAVICHSLCRPFPHYHAVSTPGLASCGDCIGDFQGPATYHGQFYLLGAVSDDRASDHLPTPCTSAVSSSAADKDKKKSQTVHALTRRSISYVPRLHDHHVDFCASYTSMGNIDLIHVGLSTNKPSGVPPSQPNPMRLSDQVTRRSSTGPYLHTTSCPHLRASCLI